MGIRFARRKSRSVHAIIFNATVYEDDWNPLALVYVVQLNIVN